MSPNATSMPGSTAADGGRIVALQAVHRHHGRGLGEAVALADRQPQPDEGPRDLRVERRAPADRDSQPPPQAIEELRRDQRPQQRPQKEGGLPRPPPLPPLEQVPPRAAREFEEAAPCRGGVLQLRLYGGVQALVDARHGNDRRGPHRPEVLREVRDGAREGHLRPRHHREVVAHRALEHVRQRQEREEHVTGEDVDAAQARKDVLQHVLVREHHALGTARGARGIDDRGQRAPVDGHRGPDGRLLGEPVGERAHDRIAGQVDLPHGNDADDAGQGCAHLGKPRQVLLALHHQQPRTGIVQAVGDVVRPVVDVDGHRDQALREGALVEPDPLLAVAQHDGHALSRGELLGREACAHPADHPRGLRPGVGLPRAALRVVFQVGRGAGGKRHAPGEGGREGVLRRDGNVLLVAGGHGADLGSILWGRASRLFRRKGCVAGADWALHQHAVHPPAVLEADRAQRADQLEA